LLYGTKKSGKNYTMRGLENSQESGLLIHAVEDIIGYLEIDKS
jgi:hypothetical protein